MRNNTIKNFGGGRQDDSDSNGSKTNRQRKRCQRGALLGAATRGWTWELWSPYEAARSFPVMYSFLFCCYLYFNNYFS